MRESRFQAAAAPRSVPSTNEIKVVVSIRPSVQGAAAPMRSLTRAGYCVIDWPKSSVNTSRRYERYCSQSGRFEPELLTEGFGHLLDLCWIDARRAGKLRELLGDRILGRDPGYEEIQRSGRPDHGDDHDEPSENMSKGHRDFSSGRAGSLERMPAAAFPRPPAMAYEAGLSLGRT